MPATKSSETRPKLNNIQFPIPLLPSPCYHYKQLRTIVSFYLCCTLNSNANNCVETGKLHYLTLVTNISLLFPSLISEQHSFFAVLHSAHGFAIFAVFTWFWRFTVKRSWRSFCFFWTIKRSDITFFLEEDVFGCNQVFGGC